MKPRCDWLLSIARYSYLGILRKLPSPVALRIEYVRINHRIPRLRDPQRFTEKLLWRQLNDDRLSLINASGKLWGKQRAQQSGTLGVPTTYWQGAAGAIRRNEHILSLPAKREWVLKQNNLGGGIVYFGHGRQPYDASVEDFFQQCETASANFQHFGGPAWRESRGGFFIEEFVGTSVPIDYKFHVFHGRVQIVSIYEGRFDELSVHHYTRTGRPLKIASKRVGPPNSMPLNALSMIPIAERLANGFDYIRVDLYDVEGCAYFGEYAPFPALDGLGRSSKIDRYLGSLW